MLRFTALAALAWVVLSSLSFAAGYPDAQCGLSSDKASIIVTASNGDAQSYRCTAFCKANITGARPFDNFDCSFNLAKGAGEKIVCTKKGGKPNYYADVLPTKSTCEPR
jgi:hypothetical protein